MDVAGTGGGDVAGSGGDGLGGGNNNAGTMAQAGSGGSNTAGKGGTGGGGTGGSSAGTGGTGGSNAAGSGGAGAGGSGGSGGAGGQPAAGSGGSGGGCATEYTTASHVMMNVSWDGTIGIKVGSGVVHIWTKTKWSEDGNSATLESMSCGSVLPEIQTTALGGGKKVLPEIPNAAWDNANMPKFIGTATKNGSTVTVTPGVALVGLTMPDPSIAWPGRTSIMGVDHDGDSKLGITAIPKTGGDYGAPPVAAFSSTKADKLYLATRNVMTLTSTMTTDCPQEWSGTANVTKFDSHVIGCHTTDNKECTSAQATFVDDNRTVYKPGTATFEAKIVADDATCEDIRNALPMN